MNMLSRIHPKAAAQKLKGMGVRGDTELVHVNRGEVAMLEAMSGNRSRNQRTGLRQFYGGAAESEGAAADQNSAADRDVTVGMSGGYGGEGATHSAVNPGKLDRSTIASIAATLGLDLSKVGIADLMAGMMPGGRLAMEGAEKIGKANEAQIAEAFAAGRISAEDMASINAGGRGTIRGGGLAGEDVTVGLGPSPSGEGGGWGDTDTEYRTDGRGQGQGQQTGTGTPAEVTPTPVVGTDRARIIKAGGGSADRIKNLIETFKTGPKGTNMDTLGNLKRIVAGGRGRAPTVDSVESMTGERAARAGGGSRMIGAGTGGGDISGNVMSMLSALPNIRGGGEASAASGAPPGMDVLSRIVAGAGRRGDSALAAVTPEQRAALKAMGGSGGINPTTGLREYAPAGDPYVAPTQTQPPPAPVGSVESNTGSAGKFNEAPDLSGFESLAKEYGSLSALPADARSGAYANLVDRRNSLLGGYSDDQLQRVAGQYYGGAGIMYRPGGGATVNRQMLMDTIGRQDADYYRSIGPIESDARRPPTGGPGESGGSAPLLPPRVGGTAPPPPTNAVGWNAMFGSATPTGAGVGQMVNGVDPNQTPEAQNAAIQRWLQQQAAATGAIRSPGAPTAAAAAGGAATTPWTQLTRQPTRSRQFRSRRTPYEGIYR
jgi:hypothetical protein